MQDRKVCADGIETTDARRWLEGREKYAKLKEQKDLDRQTRDPGT